MGKRLFSASVNVLAVVLVAGAFLLWTHARERAAVDRANLARFVDSVQVAQRADSAARAQWDSVMGHKIAVLYASRQVALDSAARASARAAAAAESLIVAHSAGDSILAYQGVVRAQASVILTLRAAMAQSDSIIAVQDSTVRLLRHDIANLEASNAALIGRLQPHRSLANSTVVRAAIGILAVKGAVDLVRGR